MALFNRLKEAVFLKSDSAAEMQLAQLEELLPKADGSLADQIRQEIRNVKAGLYGEEQMAFELRNSHIPMYVLHDLFLKHGDYTAQIDYLIVTKKITFILECKNLFGDISIDSDGNFTRSVQNGRYTKKEGIYSPITQNRRHIDVIKALRYDEHGFLGKLFFDHNFDDNYRGVVVLANKQTVLNARYAKKEVKSQVIRADQLAEYIRKANDESKVPAFTDKEMESLARYFLLQHQDNPTDYTAKYRAQIDAAAEQTEQLPKAIQNKTASQVVQPRDIHTCPNCGKPLVLRTARKGSNAGNKFYGCSGYPTCRYIQNI